jgi:hypothetical protein
MSVKVSSVTVRFRSTFQISLCLHMYWYFNTKHCGGRRYNNLPDHFANKDCVADDSWANRAAGQLAGCIQYSTNGEGPYSTALPIRYSILYSLLIIDDEAAINIYIYWQVAYIHTVYIFIYEYIIKVYIFFKERLPYTIQCTVNNTACTIWIVPKLRLVNMISAD